MLRKSGEKHIQSIKHTIALRIEDGHYYPKAIDVDGNIVRRKVITADGFRLMNAIAGVSLVMPRTVLDDSGVEVSNPIITRHGGVVTGVRIRQLAIGRAANGNLRTIDLTLSYDPVAYFASELFDLWAERGFPAWGILANAEQAQAAVANKLSRGMTPIGGGNCLVYDMTNRDVIQLLKKSANNGPFIDRTAATLVERNLLRRHFGTSFANEDGTVDFLSWKELDNEIVDVSNLSDDLLLYGAVERHEETVSDVSDAVVDAEDAVPQQSIATLIRTEVRRVGDYRRCAAECKDILEEHGIKWGSIGTSTNDKALEAIYKRIKLLV
jgi:hypothetical protein